MPVTDLSIYSETKKKLAFNSTHIFENEIITLVSLSVSILMVFHLLYTSKTWSKLHNVNIKHSIQILNVFSFKCSCKLTMKSELNSTITGIVKMIIFFTATINDRFKIIIRNKKFEPIWLRYICTNLVIPMSMEAWKWRNRVLTKFLFNFERKLYLCLKLFWTYGVGDLLVTKNHGHSGATQDMWNQKTRDDNIFL